MRVSSQIVLYCTEVLRCVLDCVECDAGGWLGGEGWVVEVRNKLVYYAHTCLTSQQLGVDSVVVSHSESGGGGGVRDMGGVQGGGIWEVGGRILAFVHVLSMSRGHGRWGCVCKRQVKRGKHFVYLSVTPSFV